jgi:hypothetical protein
MSIERNFNETFVARLAAREKQIQQHYRPIISVHKWFARRPGTLFRALLLAEFAEGRVDRGFADGHELTGVCLDPFMGGGSPLFEGVRLGLGAIGYDTNPMSRWLVEREIEDLNPDELAQAGERVTADVEGEIAHLQRTACLDCGADADVRYFLWVRHHRCACGVEHPLLADTLVVSTGLGRHPRELHVCPACLSISESDPGKQPTRCRACREPFADHLVPPGELRLCSCGEPYRIPPHGTAEVPCQRLAVIEYRCACRGKRDGERRYKQPDARDHALVAESERLVAERKSPFWPDELIPPGEETKRLLRWGYLRWRDLFNGRQLHGLGLLAGRIGEEPEGPVKRALQTCFSDFLRYQTMLCRYDRQALKPTDVFAVHGFPVPRVMCESALLGTRGAGSGGFRHALAKYERAKRWCRDPYETLFREGRRVRVRTQPECVVATVGDLGASLRDPRAAYLRRASLAEGDLPEASVDIVLTDPPYYANVQYAELMDFSYAWLRRLAPDTPFFDMPRTKSDEDAVGSLRSGEVSLVEFGRRLSGVFSAAARALKPGGAFALTYHHNDLAAYSPLVLGCLDAGLLPTAVFGCPSEMRVSTHIRSRHAATADTVFVLRRPPLPPGLKKDFSELNVQRAVDGRVAALRRAGLNPTAADRACFHHSMLAVRAMSNLAEDWDRELDVTERQARVDEALGIGYDRGWVSVAP